MCSCRCEKGYENCRDVLPPKRTIIVFIDLTTTIIIIIIIIIVQCSHPAEGTHPAGLPRERAAVIRGRAAGLLLGATFGPARALPAPALCPTLELGWQADGHARGRGRVRVTAKQRGSEARQHQIQRDSGQEARQ